MDLGVACGEGESEADGGNGGGSTEGKGVDTLFEPVVLFIVCLLVVPSLRIKMWFLIAFDLFKVLLICTLRP